MSKRLLRCADCNRLLLLGPHNRAPSYRFEASNLDPIELYCDDEAEFRGQHEGHAMDEVSLIEGSYVSTGTWGDPMREGYFEATDGKNVFVVRRWRTRLDRPVTYEVVPGVLDVQPVSIEVQRKDLERQIEADLSEGIDRRILKQFVQAVENVASNLEYEDLEEVCADRRDPLVTYLRFNEKHVAEILDQISTAAPAVVLRRLREFVRENSEGDDVMNLVARKAFAVREPAGAGSPALRG